MSDDIQLVVPVEDMPAQEQTIGEAMEAVTEAATTASKAREGQVKLFHPDYESLVFGPGGVHDGSNIIFGPRGGNEPNVWIGPADHPLLESLLAKHPRIVDATSSEKQVYMCASCSPPTAFGSLASWRGHQSKHKPQTVKA